MLRGDSPPSDEGRTDKEICLDGRLNDVAVYEIVNSRVTEVCLLNSHVFLRAFFSSCRREKSPSWQLSDMGDCFKTTQSLNYSVIPYSYCIRMKSCFEINND